MIKINLLPQQKRAKITHVEKDVMLLVSILLVLFLTVFLVDYYYTEQISDLNSQLSVKIQTKKQLEQQVAHVNAVSQDLESIQKRIRVIKDIRLRQGLPVKFIDEVVTNIPQNKMWIESFTLAVNGQILLTGVALDNQSFVTYVEKLRSSKYISKVDTQRTSRRSIDGLGLIAFQCSVATQEYFENLDTNGTANG